MRPADTSLEAWQVQTDLLRKMSPGEKMQLAFEWSEIVRQFAEAGLREKYPEAGEREIFLRYARQSLGEELFRKVYGSELTDDAPAGQNILNYSPRRWTGWRCHIPWSVRWPRPRAGAIAPRRISMCWPRSG